MNYIDSIFASLRALRVNVMRSVLTTLGIIIGVAAVIIMVSVGAGAEAQVNELIRSLGANLIIVLPGTTTSGGVRLGHGTRLTLTEDDAAAIQREIQIVQVAAPSVRGRWSGGVRQPELVYTHLWSNTRIPRGTGVGNCRLAVPSHLMR